MYRSKKDIDKHVHSLISKLSVKEFNLRGHSIGQLYYDVGEYSSCRKYVEKYVNEHKDNAAAHVLLGQALYKLGLHSEALNHFNISLEISPQRTSLIICMCEVLANDDFIIDHAQVMQWCERIKILYPNHPVSFRLREKLLATDTNPEALTILLTEELKIRPKDAFLHMRLINHYLNNNQIDEAFKHSCDVEFGETNFLHNYDWYDTLAQVLNCNPRNNNDWLRQLLSLTVTERLCVLSLTDTFNKTLLESCELLHIYDQAIDTVAKAGAHPGYAEFHSGLLQHHRSQFAFHATTYLLKQGKKNQISWRDAVRDAGPLVLIAWHSVPFDNNASWVKSAPKFQQTAALRWYSDGSYRCSQSGHFLLSNALNNSESFLEHVSQSYSGANWRNNLYGKIFTSRYHLEKIKTSNLTSNGFRAPILRLPKRNEVEVYDDEAQRGEYSNSLHHFVWLLLKYKDYSQFKCTCFDMLSLTPENNANCGPDTLNQLDIYAFLYCASLTYEQNHSNQEWLKKPEQPTTLPANITDLLCSLSQMKWWDCAYKFSQNKLGTLMTDILSRGIKIVRCVDEHGLHPELLCKLGRLFGKRAEQTSNLDEKISLHRRAELYYSSAIPLLEENQIKQNVKNKNHMFEYTRNELKQSEIQELLEECKIYMARCHLNDCKYEETIKLLSNINSPQALYHIADAYKNIALGSQNYVTNVQDDEAHSKFIALLSKAQKNCHEVLLKLRDSNTQSSRILKKDVENLLREVESNLNTNLLDSSLKYEYANNYSDEYSSFQESSAMHPKSQKVFYLQSSSTPKLLKYEQVFQRPSYESQTIYNNQNNQSSLERFENQILHLQKRDSTITDFMENTKSWFEENNNLVKQIMKSINLNMQNTTDQFNLLRISVDNVKGQMDECRNEFKEVGELRKQVADLRKDINKLKKASSEQAMVESELFNLDEEFRSNEAASSFTAQLPFMPQQVIPPFNQRLIPPFPVPPNPFQLYSQNLFNLYNQYSQPPTVPAAPPMFDSARQQVNYPGAFSTPDQMYLDVAHLVQPSMPPATAVPIVPVVTSVPTTVTTSNLPIVSLPLNTASMEKPKIDYKDTSRTLPANVVITSSDPLPTFTSVPAPVLSVTIPSKHIKVPHNYQISMPSTTESSVLTSPSFSFSGLGNKTNANILSNNWPQTSIFNNISSVSAKTIVATSLPQNLEESKLDDDVSHVSLNNSLNRSKTLSEKSNTSIENYDPCPDFKPIIPLPAEVVVTTGEEDETAIFSSRAKLFRFVDKQWKERGLGEMKLLKHKDTGKVRVLMRREQIHKICANHIITPDMVIKPMKNETKAYFWVANDFAEESIVLEKFCVRFKTADTARQFYETFEKARQESNRVDSDVKTQTEIPVSKSNDTQSTKTVLGGFTFSTAPAFKTVSETENSKLTSESTPPKVNVFSGLSFKTTASPFSNLFSSSNTEVNKESVSVQSPHTSEKLNTSNTAEDFEPTIEFKPLIPLPALVDQKTGEEDEIILFEHRAKLLRFVASTKEWKERGLGNIKILVHKDNEQKLRLLMRREQVKKVCCNHAITKTMMFQKMPNVDKAVTWCAQDFSEGELIPETFCLRFKTAQACNDFIEAVKNAQSKLKDKSSAQEKSNDAKQNQQSNDKSDNSNWGDKFKPKIGTWECRQCYVRNEPNVEMCSCCNNPNPNVSITEANKPPITKIEPKFKFGIALLTSNDDQTKAQALKPNTQSSWGDKFKPALGSWECAACLIRNDANVENCSACTSPRNVGVNKSAPKTVPNTNEVKFKFGIPLQPVTGQTNEVLKTNLSAKSNWGDNMFKPALGSWECKECSVRNEGNSETCCACSAKNTGIIFKPATVPKLNFGIQPIKTGDQSKNDTTSIFDGTGVHKFSFGIPSNTHKESVGSPATNKLNLTVSEEKRETTEQETKPALLPTPQTFASECGKFDFVFKPKIETKSSPVKSSACDKGNESDDNEYAAEDEGHHIQITPIIPLPDKVKVVTGEEDEDELYAHRAKLFIFVSGEWKERGIGIVKILKHKYTGKLRVVMRREQVFKICLNHALTSDIMYNLKDEKNWIFAANDFSDGELNLQSFCLMFKTKDIAAQFKDAIDEARSGKLKPVIQKINEDIEKDDVEFIAEIQSNADEKQKAKELMLPENFYLYKNKEPCRGCRGCENDSDLTPTKCTTPIKPLFLTLNDSIYYTPKTSESPEVAASIKSPVEIIDSNINSVQRPMTSENIFKDDSSNTVNNKIKDINLFAKEWPSSLGAGNSQNGTSTSNTKITSQNQYPTDAKSIFSMADSGMSGTTFGQLSGSKQNTGGIFGSFATSSSNTENRSDVKSIFDGNSGQKNFNLFSNNSQSNIFGPGALSNQNKSSQQFLLNSNASGYFTNLGQTSTENKNNQSIWSFNKNTDFNETVVDSTETKIQDTKASNNLFKSPILGAGNALTFDALSNKAEFKMEKRPDFKWEGAGQQLFAQVPKKETDKNTGNGDDTNDADNEGETGNGGEEEFDPHYEPIIPLPDKIVVTTGEEDEEKIFGHRCKLYRYDDEKREWKERGVGELKLLYHPEKNTYRLLFRREQVHKAVLNMLLFTNMELRPMNKTDRAWTWAGCNFAESAAGQQEMLAVRFKTMELANEFFDKVKYSVRKLEAAAAAQVIRDKHHETKSVPLLTSKHSQDSARADAFVAVQTEQDVSKIQPLSERTNVPQTRRLLFDDTEPDNAYGDGEGENCEQAYYQTDDYDTYYSDDDAVYFSSDCEAVVQQSTSETACTQAHVLVLFDQSIYSPKIQVTNGNTGEILADMVIYDDMEFQMTNNSCTWSGTDYTSNDAIDTTVTVNFPDSDTAMQFYDSCESSKGQHVAAENES